MKNISKKIIASFMLTAFLFTNAILTASAMENSAFDDAKPTLRDTNKEFSLKLKGDVSYIKTETPVSISLRDSDVKQVLRMFADKAGMNIIFHESVAGQVTLDLVDVPLNEAFDMILSITGMNYVVENNTIIVAKSDSTDFDMTKQDMTLIPVKYVNAAALAKFLNENIFKMKKPGLSSSDIVSTNPVTNELIVFGSSNDVAIAKRIVEKFDVKPKTTTFKVNHTTPQEMANMICGMLIPATGAAAGMKLTNEEGVMTGAAAGDDGGLTGTSAMSTGGNSGGGSDSSMTLNSGSVACTLDGGMSGSVSSFGLKNMSIAYYPQLGTISVLGGSEHQIEMIRDFIKDTDKKQPQAYLEVSIIELTEAGSKELSNNWKVLSKYFSATFDGTKTSMDPVYPTILKGNGYNIIKTEEDSAPEVLYRIGKYSGPATISYTINYLIENSKARVVVNPRIVITNGVESKIDVTQDYLESVDVEASTSTAGTVITREFNIGNDQGVTMTIMPFISPDGYVTLNITPEYSTQAGEIYSRDSVAGEYKAATLLAHRNLDLKNIRIKDGETLIIAGMIQESDTKTVNKIPVLGDLPVVGALFRSTSSGKAKSEMLIMLTPKIITDNEDAVGNIDTL